MSKSLGNFLTIDDVVNKGYDPMALRLLFLQTHYRNEMNFTWAALDAAQTAYTRMVERLTHEGVVDAQLDTQFKAALKNDLDTPVALSILMGTKNHEQASHFAQVLGLVLKPIEKTAIEVPTDISALAEKRNEAKKSKDFKMADTIRIQIESKGYKVLDSKDGTYKIVHV
jgi:cysteinyl-tRNA synthetase